MNKQQSAPLQGLMRLRLFRRFWHFMERLVPFFRVSFSREGLFSRDGRTLIWGKARRLAISAFPPLARALQRHYGMKGGCSNCGTSCQLLFRCPHWVAESRLCSVYEDRPSICRMFPITPADIRDRNIAAKKNGTVCGFTFKPVGHQNANLVPQPAPASSPSYSRD